VDGVIDSDANETAPQRLPLHHIPSPNFHDATAMWASEHNTAKQRSERSAQHARQNPEIQAAYP
jgi:hypothetical protein